MSKVVIIGAGMGGLAAAHELIERGFQVEVYEKRRILGGKARSVEVAGTGGSGTRPLPGEDGFRFFPGFYKHVPDSMKRIPYQGRTVYENLVPAKEIGILQAGRQPVFFPSGFPQTIDDWRQTIEFLFTRPELGLTHEEATFFASRILCFLGSSENRRLQQYEGLKWWDFVEAPRWSEQYRKLCARGLTRSLVAMRAEDASTRSIGTILVQVLMDILNPQQQADRVLNGPTNEAWINPWEDYLQLRGAQFQRQVQAVRLNFDGSRITSVRIRNLVSSTEQDVQGDYYVLAVPVEVMNGYPGSPPLITSDIATAAPSLANLSQVKTAWMVGIQFYLNRMLSTPIGHSIYADSPWAVTSISQGQFWTGIDIPNTYGDGTVKDILSCDISEWNTPGNQVFTRPAKDAGSKEDIQKEVWEQIKVHWASSPAGQLSDGDLVRWFLSPQIEFVNGRPINTEPLLINTINSRQYRPEAATGIPNLFLASDYVRTHTDLATMEAANEAGRRAAAAILAAEGSTASPVDIWELQEPDIFKPLKEADALLFDLNPNSPAVLCSVLGAQVTSGSSFSTPLSGPSSPSPAPASSSPTTMEWILLGLLILVVVLVTIVLIVLLV